MSQDTEPQKKYWFRIHATPLDQSFYASVVANGMGLTSVIHHILKSNTKINKLYIENKLSEISEAGKITTKDIGESYHFVGEVIPATIFFQKLFTSLGKSDKKCDFEDRIAVLTRNDDATTIIGEGFFDKTTVYEPDALVPIYHAGQITEFGDYRLSKRELKIIAPGIIDFALK